MSTSIKIKSVNIFTDAQIVLSWLLSPKIKIGKVFVKNRINDINGLIKQIEADFDLKVSLNYVKSEENPADLITRGMSTNEFENNLNFWKRGPVWLNKSSNSWPQHDLKCLSDYSRTLTACSNVMLLSGDVCVNAIFDIHKYSNLQKVLRITKIVISFCYKCRKVELDCNYLAKSYWLKIMQSESFVNEMHYLKLSSLEKEKVKVPELINKLNLFLDDDLMIRSRGRISKTTYYDYNVLNPIMLGKYHHFTKLIISDAHLKCKHLGLSATLNYIRVHGAWISQGRQVVKSVISECFLCRKHNQFAFNYPKFTNMIKPAVNFFRPFQHVGVDYTGHLWIKGSNDKCTKMYILIYTCLNIRAIHLDLLPDMSTSSFLMSFKRFTVAFGVPSHLYSDNALSFVKGGNVLENSLVSNEFSEYLSKSDIVHIKIPVYSAWFGAMWERMIRTLKNCMYKTIGKARLSYFEMITQLSLIQDAINSRPLTYRSTEVDLIALTPNDFIKMHCKRSLILQFKDVKGLWEQDPPTGRFLSESLLNLNELFCEFRKEWYENYLLSLREGCRDLHQIDWKNRIKVDDIVLIKDVMKPRAFWSLGRVTRLFPGIDGIIRSAMVKTAKTTSHHSIKHLYPMELSISHSGSLETEDVTVQDNQLKVNPECVEEKGVEDLSKSSRPKRRAAEKCRKTFLALKPLL